MSVGNNIKRYREARGMSQIQLAEALGESRQTIYKYETGVVANVPIIKIERIAGILGCSPAALAGWQQRDDYILYEDTAPSRTRHEQELLEAWKRATDKEKMIIIAILREYGMDSFD